MAGELRLRRGTTAQHRSFTGANGEVTFNTDTKELHTHDGVTSGGFPLVRKDALAAPDSTVLVGGVSASIIVKERRRNISHYISKAQYEDALAGNPQMDTTAGWNDALNDTGIFALDFKGVYKVSGTGPACITQNANVSIYGNSPRDSAIRADFAGPTTNILNLQISNNGGLGDVRGWEAKNFSMFHNGGGASCIENTGGLPMLNCEISRLNLQAGLAPGARDLILTRAAFTVISQCTSGSGFTIGTPAFQSADGNKLYNNTFFGTGPSLILDIMPGAYRTEVYGGTMVSRDGGVKILRGSQIAIRGVQFEQFPDFGENQSPESAHISIFGTGQRCENILIEANNFGGGTNVQHLIWVDNASNVDITKNTMNAPLTADLYTTVNAFYTKPRLDNILVGSPFNNPRDTNSRFPMVVIDNGIGTYNVLKNQTNLQNGWVGGQFYKDETDKVVINTGFNGGSIALSTVICNMPEGFRPADFYTLPAVSDAGFCVVMAQPNGNLIVGPNSGSSNSSFASNLTFASRRNN